MSMNRSFGNIQEKQGKSIIFQSRLMAKIKVHPLILLFLLISLSSCLSLAEDITPPPGLNTPTTQLTPKVNPTQQNMSIVFPREIPNPNKGAVIYVEKCSSCHGVNGLGDGPDAAVIENSVPALGSITLAQTASPVEWYIIVSQGNMRAFMPPFSSLSDQERWDVVAYLFTLSEPPEIVSQGKTLFVENCVKCHGEDGSQGAVDLSDQVFMSGQSTDSMIAIISDGHELMPAFEALSSDQLWALTAYLRQAAFVPFETQIASDLSATEAIAPESPSNASESAEQAELPPHEEETNSGFADVEVTVLNHSDQALPSDLEIVLRGYDEMSESYTQTLTLKMGNAVEFKEVPMKLGRMYFATIEHGNATYGSNVISVEEDISSLAFEIPYYPPTTNPAILNVDRMHIFIDFVDDQTLEIVQLYIFSNPTNLVLVPKEADGTVVNFDIPSNASNLYVEENLRLAYRKTNSGFGIISVYPDIDSYQAVFSYQVPYINKSLNLSIPIGMETHALIVLAPANGFKVKSDLLENAGTREFEGVSYNMFTGTGIGTGNSLLLNLSGRPKVTDNLLISSGNSRSNLIIGLGGFGLALITTGLILGRRNQDDKEKHLEGETREDPMSETALDLIDAIIALDDQYRSGRLPKEAYYQRRAVLKERLRGAVKSE